MLGDFCNREISVWGQVLRFGEEVPHAVRRWGSGVIRTKFP